MSRRYYISGEVTDGDHLSELMSANFSKAELSSIIFFSDEYNTIATPTGGEVKFLMSPDDTHFRTTDQGTFQASDSYSEDRTPPNGANLAIRAKVNFSGVTGVTHFLAVIWRS